MWAAHPLPHLFLTNMKKYLILSALLLAVVSCGNNGNRGNAQDGPNAAQQELIDNGWEFYTPDNGDLPSKYGVRPVKGLLDNYFDIEMGEGGNMAVKIVDAETENTIRYVYVSENTKTTITEIPAGKYYLKLAFGYDWMKYDQGSIIRGKFSKSAYYQISDEIFDFGAKNTMYARSFSLKIHTNHDPNYISFSTSEISEEQFVGRDL